MFIYENNKLIIYLILFQLLLLLMLIMFNTKFYISMLDLNTFDREHYVIGQNENVNILKLNYLLFEPAL